MLIAELSEYQAPRNLLLIWLGLKCQQFPNFTCVWKLNFHHSDCQHMSSTSLSYIVVVIFFIYLIYLILPHHSDFMRIQIWSLNFAIQITLTNIILVYSYTLKSIFCFVSSLGWKHSTHGREEMKIKILSIHYKKTF